MHDIEALTEYVIERGFPEVAEVNPSVYWKDLGEPNLIFFRVLDSTGRKEYCIAADHSFKRTSKEALVGGLAHECAHISRAICEPIREKLESRFTRLGLVRNYIERKTDALAVERGFGNELKETLHFFQRYRYEREEGLSIEEIDALMYRINSQHTF